jgi:hypothetical protein
LLDGFFAVFDTALGSGLLVFTDLGAIFLAADLVVEALALADFAKVFPLALVFCLLGLFAAGFPFDAGLLGDLEADLGVGTGMVEYLSSSAELSFEISALACIKLDVHFCNS